MRNYYVEAIFHPKDEVEAGFISDLLIYFCLGEMEDLIRMAKGFRIRISKKPTRLELIIKLVEKMREPLRVT